MVGFLQERKKNTRTTFAEERRIRLETRFQRTPHQYIKFKAGGRITLYIHRIECDHSFHSWPFNELSTKYHLLALRQLNAERSMSNRKGSEGEKT